MLYEPGERQTTLEQQQRRLEALSNATRHAMLLAELNDNIVGFVTGSGGNLKRNRHTLSIVIGVLQAFAGQGVGRLLMAALENWAVTNEFHRLELTVIAHNDTAIRLYKSCGFESEGVRADALVIDDQYVDELYMAKII